MALTRGSHWSVVYTAVKRIMQEARELANDPCTDYSAAPLEVRGSFCAIFFTGLIISPVGRYLCMSSLKIFLTDI